MSYHCMHAVAVASNIIVLVRAPAAAALLDSSEDECDDDSDARAAAKATAAARERSGAGLSLDGKRKRADTPPEGAGPWNTELTELSFKKLKEGCKALGLKDSGQRHRLLARLQRYQQQLQNVDSVPAGVVVVVVVVVVVLLVAAVVVLVRTWQAPCNRLVH